MSEPRTIWKFPLRITDVQHIAIPRGVQFLSAQVQVGEIVAWALVHPGNPTESVEVQVIGTGNDITPGMLTGMRHLATVQQFPFVWHIFVPEAA
jgi:hypothetical protein